MSRTKPSHNVVNSALDSKTSDPLLGAFQGRCFRIKSNVGTLVEQHRYIFKHYVGLQNPDSIVQLNFSDKWRKGRYPTRVLIHPRSSNTKKNWPRARFLELAHQLKLSGYEPVFTMSPDEKKIG